ncbi:hypothetical protein QQZ08_003363 [Neonectria magnoliae]|uniref:Uncharacterized protein n=1 Tax=Neonectria magnoliae TaxID=2732573 RepID=A0ABR1I998_9HYPO
MIDRPRLAGGTSEAGGRNLRGWVAAAITTWVDPPPSDAWLARYSPKKAIINADENRPWLGFKDDYDSRFSDIAFFLLPDSRAKFLGDRVRILEDFCKGAELDLDTSATPSPQEEQTAALQHRTEAWVSDRNRNFQDPNAPFDYPRELSPRQLYEVLQHKLLPDDPAEQADAPPRRIYINNANGPCILSLIRTASQSQAQGHRELFANYINPAPEPCMSIKDCHLWNGSFIILAQFPYFAISNTDREDTRIYRGKRKFRRRHDFSFSNPTNSIKQDSDKEPGYQFLYEVVCSFMATGKSDSHWSAVCLNEDSFEETPRLESEEDMDIDGLDSDSDDVDPITDEPPLAMPTVSPRVYSLQFFDRHFELVVAHQKKIHEEFRASLSRHSPASPEDPRDCLSPDQAKDWTTKSLNSLSLVLHSIAQQRGELDRFFTREVILDQNDMPTGRLLQSLRGDPLALKSLQNLRKSLEELRVIERGIEGSKRDFEEIRLQTHSVSIRIAF